jgi:hypothetical protein
MASRHGCLGPGGPVNVEGAPLDPCRARVDAALARSTPQLQLHLTEHVNEVASMTIFGIKLAENARHNELQSYAVSRNCSTILALAAALSTPAQPSPASRPSANAYRHSDTILASIGSSFWRSPQSQSISSTLSVSK